MRVGGRVQEAAVLPLAVLAGERLRRCGGGRGARGHQQVVVDAGQRLARVVGRQRVQLQLVDAGARRTDDERRRAARPAALLQHILRDVVGALRRDGQQLRRHAQRAAAAARLHRHRHRHLRAVHLHVRVGVRHARQPEAREAWLRPEVAGRQRGQRARRAARAERVAHHQVLVGVVERVAVALRVVGVDLEAVLAGRRRRHREDGRVAADHALDHVAGEQRLVVRVALQLRREAQRPAEAQPQLRAPADRAEDGAALQRLHLVAAGAVAGAPARVDARRERRAARPALAAQLVLAHAAVHAVGARLADVLRVDDQSVGAVARRPHREERHAVQHLLHAVAVQLRAVQLVPAVLRRQRERERERRRAVARTPDPHRHLAARPHDRLAMTQDLQAVLEERRLDRHEPLEVGERDDGREQLPAGVDRQVREDELVRVGHEVVLVELVANVLHRHLQREGGEGEGGMGGRGRGG